MRCLHREGPWQCESAESGEEAGRMEVGSHALPPPLVVAAGIEEGEQREREVREEGVLR